MSKSPAQRARNRADLSRTLRKVLDRKTARFFLGVVGPSPDPHSKRAGTNMSTQLTESGTVRTTITITFEDPAEG